MPGYADNQVWSGEEDETRNEEEEKDSLASPDLTGIVVVSNRKHTDVN